MTSNSNLAISSPDTFISININDIPVDIGDRKWLIYRWRVDMGMGTPSYGTVCAVLPSGQEVLYHVPYETYGRFLANYNTTDTGNTRIQGRRLTNMTAALTPTAKDIALLKVPSEISSTVDNLVWGLSTYGFGGGGTDCLAFATNAEIRDLSGNVLKPAGPSGWSTL